MGARGGQGEVEKGRTDGCALLSRSGTARGLAGDASERGRDGGRKGKKEGAAGGASRAGLLQEEERGKLTGGARASAAPGEGEGARGGAAVGGLGRVGRAWKEGKGKEKGGNGAGLGRCLCVGCAGP
jgi:hypothetical protein